MANSPMTRTQFSSSLIAGAVAHTMFQTGWFGFGMSLAGLAAAALFGNLVDVIGDAIGSEALPSLFSSLGVGADINAACRFIENEELRVGGEPAGQEHLLLVAARQEADRLFGVRRPDIEAPDKILGHFCLLPARHRAGPANAGLKGEDDVLADAEIGDDAIQLPVFGAEAEACGHRIARGAQFDLLAV